MSARQPHQGTVSYYIYYKIAPERSAETAATVSAVLDDVAAQTGVRGAALRRQDDPLTWMEVFQGVTERSRFEAALEEALRRHRFARVLAPGAHRVTERFVAAS